MLLTEFKTVFLSVKLDRSLSSPDFITIMKHTCNFSWREVTFDICMVLLRCVGDAIRPQIPACRAIGECWHCLVTVIKLTLSSELSAEEIVFHLRNKKTKQLNNHFGFMSSDRCIYSHKHLLIKEIKSNAQSH